MKRVLALATVAILAVLGFVVLGTNPLEKGSVSALDQTGLDPSGEFYLYAPDSDYYLLTAIRNGGQIPVSVKGPHSPADVQSVGPYAAQFLIARGVDPASGGPTPRSAAAPFTGVDLAPGDEVWIWVDFHTGPCLADGSLPYAPGSGGGTNEIQVDWSILGVPRVSSVPLSIDLDIRNVDSYDLCAR